jgi:hypothetical protein
LPLIKVLVPNEEGASAFYNMFLSASYFWTGSGRRPLLPKGLFVAANIPGDISGA